MELIKMPVHVILGFDMHTRILIRSLKSKGVKNICVLDYDREVEGEQHDFVFFFTPDETLEYIQLFEKKVFHKYMKAVV